MNRHSFWFPAFVAFTLCWTALSCAAQEIEPRRWSHLPIGSNFFGGAYGYTKGDILFDPLLRIDDAHFDLHTIAGKYIRSFAFLGKSARIDILQGYQSGKWTGLLNGVPASVSREGWTDTNVRFAVNLYGAPPLEGKEFAEYRAAADIETIIGAGIAVQLPTGHYLEDKLINLGSNRFTFRPQLGVVHTRGKWSFELNGGVWLFTENDEFFNGGSLEQDPLFTTDSSVIYTFRPGLWVGASAGYGGGSATALNGVNNNNAQKNVGLGLSMGIPINRQLGLKFAYIGTRTHVSNGLDSDTLTCAFSVMW